MSYITRLSQAATVDTNNSSSANLSQNAYFIGLPTSTLGVNSIQVSLKSDQNCTIYVEQSPGTVTGVSTVTTTNPGSVGTITGVATKFQRDFKVGDQIFIAGETTHYIASIVSDTVMTATATFAGVAGAAYTFYPWDLSDMFLYYANNNFGRTTQAISSYLRVRVVNTGTATSLFLRLQTVLCPIVDSVPRALNSLGYLRAGDFDNDVAQGDAPFATPWYKIGYTPTMNNTDSDIWSGAGVYTPPASGVQMRVLSSSANDTGAGTNAQQVTIYYLDSNYVSQSETVTLNGVTPVSTVSTDIFRLNGFRVTRVGAIATAKAAGNIQLQLLAAPNTVYGYITAGYTRGRNSFYTVPAGKTLYINKVNFSFGFGTTAGNTLIYMRGYTRITYNDQLGVTTTSTGIFYPYHEGIVSNSDFMSDLKVPTKIPEKVDIKVSGITNSATAGAAASVLRGYLIG